MLKTKKITSTIFLPIHPTVPRRPSPPEAVSPPAPPPTSHHPRLPFSSPPLPLFTTAAPCPSLVADGCMILPPPYRRATILTKPFPSSLSLPLPPTLALADSCFLAMQFPKPPPPPRQLHVSPLSSPLGCCHRRIF